MDCLVDGITVFKMKGQRFVEFRQPVPEKIFDYIADLFMNIPSLFFEKTVINHLLGQGMLENVFQIRLEGFGSDKVKLFQPPDRSVNVLFRVSDSFEDFKKKHPSYYRGLLNNQLGLLFQTVEPGGKIAVSVSDGYGYGVLRVAATEGK